MLSRTLVRQSRRAAVRAMATASAWTQQDGNAQATATAAALIGLVAGTATVLNEEAKYQKRPPQKYESPEPILAHPKGSHNADYNDPPPRPDLPTIPLEEVAEHSDEDSLWYTFRGAVYDMTFFINGHPGGTPVSLRFAVGYIPCG